eukprot:GHVS01019981.1.p1 GENE.GHVS01019981.1~~GHVS01019981.1.p1  ORF type:complete len:159 (+),score=22.47 GHVS01019981.1:204-680(+)
MLAGARASLPPAAASSPSSWRCWCSPTVCQLVAAASEWSDEDFLDCRDGGEELDLPRGSSIYRYHATGLSFSAKVANRSSQDFLVDLAQLQVCDNRPTLQHACGADRDWVTSKFRFHQLQRRDSNSSHRLFENVSTHHDILHKRRSSRARSSSAKQSH